MALASSGSAATSPTAVLSSGAACRLLQAPTGGAGGTTIGLRFLGQRRRRLELDAGKILNHPHHT
jgi:hypothetical protein